MIKNRKRKKQILQRDMINKNMIKKVWSKLWLSISNSAKSKCYSCRKKRTNLDLEINDGTIWY